MNTENIELMPQKQWRRTESKVIRPFQFAEDLLEDTGFRLYEKDEFEEGVETIQHDELSLDDLAPEFLLNFSVDNAVASIGIAPEFLKLIVSVEDKALKQIIKFYEVQLDEDFERELRVPDAIVRKLSWCGDTKFTLAIVLSDDRDVDIGQASHAGQWLAKKTISIIKERHTATFPFKVVPPEEFLKKGLPKDTTYYVDIFGDEFNDSDSVMGQMVQVYINESVAPIMNKAEDSSAGRALLLNMYCDTAASILEVGYKKLTNIDQLQEGSVLHTVSEKLSTSTGVPIQRIFAMSKELGGSCRLRALLQSECKLTKTLSNASFSRSA